MGWPPKPSIAGMSEQQILQFIFRPGFSTAEKVTSVSGRGVGMDVVRTNIETHRRHHRTDRRWPATAPLS